MFFKNIKSLQNTSRNFDEYQSMLNPGKPVKLITISILLISIKKLQKMRSNEADSSFERIDNSLYLCYYNKVKRQGSSVHFFRRYRDGRLYDDKRSRREMGCVS